jgi:hypothetical protein
MARAPINYILDVQSPVERAMRGYQFGLGEVQAEREEDRAQQRFGMEQERFGMEQERFRTQQSAAAQAAAAQRAQAERQQAFYNDFSRVVRGELPRSELLATYPDFAETMSQTFEMIPDQVAQNRVASGQRIQSALRNNRPDIADNLLANEAEAARNSGNQAYADQLEEMRRQIEQSPRLVFEEIGLQLDAYGAESQQWVEETEATRTLRARAEMAGLTEGTPEFQEFMRTGGKESGPLVQNIIGEGESEFAKIAGARQASQYATLTETGFSASRNLRELDALEIALGGIQTGGGASVRSYLGRFGIATEGLDAIQAAEAAINRLIPAQRQPGSGDMSDADLELFKRSLPALINQPGGNQIIIDTIRAINEYDVAVSILAGQALDGDLTPAEARAAIRELPNPLAEFSAETTAPAQAEGAAAGDDLKSAFMANPVVQSLPPEIQEAAWEIYRQQVGE